MNVSMCEVILYQEHYPTISAIEEICQKYKTIKKYIISYHDRDVFENGEPKKNHYHVYLHFGRTQSTDMLKEWFNVALQDIEKIKGRWTDAEEYAVHANKPEAYQYPPEGVVASYDYINALAKAIKAKKQRKLAPLLASQILNGTKSYSQAYRELLQYDYNKDATRYLRDAYAIYSRTLSPSRQIEVVLIYGNTGTGKTTLAKLLAEAEGKDYYISASGADPMGDYMGEKVLILDDVREETFTFLEWLKLLDNNTNSAIRSRYNNKYFTGDTIYITSASNPVMWFLNINENRAQFYRRITQFIMVTDDQVSQYNGFTVNSGGWVEPVFTGMTYKNPVAQMYPKDKQTQTNNSDSAAKFTRSMASLFDKINKQNQPNFEPITDMKEIEKLTSKGENKK